MCITLISLFLIWKKNNSQNKKLFYNSNISFKNYEREKMKMTINAKP